MRVALVVMPFAATDRPSLAVGLLKAILQDAGFPCDAKYFNLTYESLLGADTYRTLSLSNMTALAGEWVFSRCLHDDLPARSDYEREVLSHPQWGLGDDLLPLLDRALAEAPSFLRLALESNDWGRYDLVGFTSTFQQTLASLCLARAIKERHPRVKIALGGANFEADMGRPYLEHYDFVDYVSTGEADASLPQLCRSLAAVARGDAERVRVPPGFLYRGDDGQVLAASSPAMPTLGGETGRVEPFVDLDRLPMPDYDDYFQSPHRSPRWLPLEASRGCWWGQKAHCTFCGLNGEGMAFRAKSWRRVVEESEALTRRYGATQLQFADNILSMEYFRDLLPYWAAQGNGSSEDGGDAGATAQPRVDKFFEVKANLRRSQVALLAAAGIRQVQPGIESLADQTLRVMRKGVSAARNVAFLRWCHELGVRPFWNLIFGFPGEDLEDFPRMLEHLKGLTHLPPPEGAGPIRLDRFSPNYDRFRENGFTAVRPMPAYRHLFPLPAEALQGLAYYFDYDHPQRDEAWKAAQPMIDFVDRWRQHHGEERGGRLAVRPHWQGGLVLVDDRFSVPGGSRRLSLLEAALLVVCDGPVTRENAVERAATACGESPERAARVLVQLTREKIVADLSNRLVGLALLPRQERLDIELSWYGCREPLRRFP